MTMGRSVANFGGAEIGPKSFRNLDRAVLALVVLQDRDERAAHGEGRAVQRVDELGFLVLGAAESNGSAPRLECLAVGAGGDLLVRLLARQPHLEVVGPRRPEPQ